MTIRPGQTWGERVPVPDAIMTVATDAELAERLEGGDGPAVRVAGGDLLASLGGPSPGEGLARFPIDLLHVDADGRRLVAVAHVVARGRTWWRGRVVAAMNVDRLGSWDVAPRAHPDDGAFDVVEVDATMSVRARAQAWRRLRTGTHVPHPAIGVGRRAEASWRFERPHRLWVDGVRRGTVRSLVVTVEPDGAVVHT